MQYLTPKMVSDKLHIGIKKTYALFRLQGFPSIRINNQWLVNDNDLEKFLEEYKDREIIV